MSTDPRWSEPVETLLEGTPPHACDVLVIGSGYGGSVAAAELAAPGRSVWVMERGREYALGEFPEDIGQLPGHVRLQRQGEDAPVGNADALLDFRLFDEVGVLVANGLGGGSLINAGVALRPPADLFDHAAWPAAYRRGGVQQGALQEAMGQVLGKLEAQAMPAAAEMPKFAALSRLGQAIGCGPAEAVPLTIAHERRTTAQGVAQDACVRCGNCFTGCNVGAKGTLLTTLIPAAAAQGARFFTGATALEIEPLAGPHRRWRVHFALTARTKAQPFVRHFSVDTHTLVLSAGTLGSTELLLRSAQVTHSSRLGHSFSANGDAIAMAWGQKERVNGISAPRPSSTGPSRDVGPTIVGTLRASVQVDGRTRTVLVQDGAVPSALSMAVLALGSSLSSLHRYVDPDVPGFHAAGAPDVLATPERIGEHALLLLAMGRDDADGRMRLVDGKAGRQVFDIHWPRGDDRARVGGRSPYFEALHETLKSAYARDDYDGGDYLPNPLWRPVPDKFSGITGGDQPERLVTVHPLGGCAMADDASAGVVNRFGEVFSGETGSAVHAGLHVLDGAIVPCAVGVNPFVTISALCLLAAREIRSRLDAQAPAAAVPLALRLPVGQPAVKERQPFAGAGPVVLKFEERLQSTGEGEVPEWALALAARMGPEVRKLATSARAWVAQVEVRLDPYAWLDDPSIAHEAQLRLYVNRWPESPTVRDEVLRPGHLVLSGAGKVTLLAPDFPKDARERKARAWKAFQAYVERRGKGDLASTASAGSGVGLWEAGRLFRQAGLNHADYRELRYDFQLRTDPAAAPVRASGVKRLAYRAEERNVWDALVQLDLKLQPATGGPAWPLPLKVDLVDMVKGRRLQVEKAPNTPAAILAVAAFGAFWLRALLRTHFWSFRGLSYDRLAPPQVPPPPPLRPQGLGGPPVQPRIVPLAVPRGHGKGGDITLELVHYPAGKNALNPKRALLFIHGLAHGSGVFTTDTIGTNNMATHFLREGYDVWLLDHRLSNRLGYAGEGHTMDMVGRYDITYAVNEVRRLSGVARLDVFAHCVGAGAFAMAVLRDREPGEQGVDPEGIGNVIIHAVHPWVVPSMSNRLSGSLAALYKDFLAGDETIRPVPPSGAGKAIDELIDRFGASLPWPAGDRKPHEHGKYDPLGGYGVCNRMTVFYGREWEHDNLDPDTHQRLGELVGVAGIEVFRQLFFVIQRERLTDREGVNAYLTRERLVQRWTFPTLFAHGGRNKVFDPRSAVRSWQRLERTFLQAGEKERTVRLYVQQGYGHMDFLFGRDAHRDVYPRLAAFLKDARGFESQVGGKPPVYLGANEVDGEDISDPEFIAPRQPLVGPLLQIEGGYGRPRELVLWFEQRSDTTSEPERPGLRVNGQDTEDFTPVRPPSQRVNGARSRNLAISEGSGWHWTVTLPDTGGRFASMERLEVEMRTRGGGAKVETRSAPANTPGWIDPRFPWGTWGPKIPIQIQRSLKNAPFPQQPAPAARPPFDSEQVAVLSFKGLPWWDRWLGRLPGDVPVSLLASSCRWPGTPFEREAADALADRMLEHLEHKTRPVDGLVLLGDQIYADATANLAETTEKAERGQDRYRAAWDGEATSRLLRHLPTWLVVDDHEFGDNMDGAGGAEFDNGFEAAMAYQWRWREKREGPAFATKDRPLRGFWHEFTIGGLPAFAADTRSERRPRDGENWQQAQLMDPRQLDAIKKWLVAHRDTPKFLCSGSVLGVPERRVLEAPSLARHADDWTGYPASWQELARFIAAERIRHLVFLSGDYHLSAVAELEIQAVGAPPARAVSVVASGWNATLPFANPRVYEHAWDEKVRLPACCASVDVWATARCLSTAHRQFTKLSVVRAGTGWALEVASYDEHGTVKEVAPIPL